ncbi:hypothetical protein UT300005_03590 [Clostridium sp. CTA-5]
MKELDKEVLIKEIMLDNDNPRFGGRIDKSQEEIREILMHGQKARELLVGMRTGLIWSNKIAIAPINELTKNERALIGSIPKGKKYITVDGNTRLACLLDDSMRETFNINEKLKVVILEKSDDESDIEYLKNRKRLQSIDNVMIVTDWNEIPKSKQLYDSYKLIKEIDPAKLENKIFKELGDQIGISLTRVKGAIFRYVFYKVLTENVEELDKHDFKYLEIFEQSNDIRTLFGYLNDKGMFIWDNKESMDDDEEIIEKRKELLYIFPKIVEIARSENINSKKLRDLIRKYKSDDLEDLLQKFKDIQDYYKASDYASDSIVSILESNLDYEEQEIKEINCKIDSVIKVLKSFPINQDYAISFKEKLLEINIRSEKLLKCLDICKND